jgi:hypothetical protein
MLAALLFAAALGSDPVFDFFPADRSRLPAHIDFFTLEDWQTVISEDIAKRECKLERQFRNADRNDKISRQLTRDHNAFMRKHGIQTPPDPVEPTESRFFKKKQ